jgi:N-acetylmuramoyl-L-alanine amidase
MRAEIKRWADENIVWAGNAHTNKSSRDGHVPDMIVDHISQGSLSSMVSWFTSSGNNVSSAHFGVGKKGEVRQFVAIEDMAWGNGLRTDGKTTPHVGQSTLTVVKSRPKVNPNKYTISIEHEGIWEQTKGELTNAQLAATIMLHEYIIEYIKDKWGKDIPVDRNHIVGHYEVAPVTKPFCPGERFPFNTIVGQLGGMTENLPFEDIADHWAKKTIVTAKEIGLINGVGDTDNNGLAEFKPDRPCTRAEMTQIALNLYNLLK